MNKIRKNTDLTGFKKLDLKHGEIYSINFLPPKFDEKDPISHTKLFYRIEGSETHRSNCTHKCPICEALKTKTTWQKIKEGISKLWKR